MLKKVGRSSVLLLVLLAVLALVGCGGSETKVNADEVVQKALAAQANLKTTRIVLDLEGTAQGNVNGSAFEASVEASVNSAIDQTNKRIHASVSLDVTATGEEPKAEDIEIYVIDNYTYMKAGDSSWMKQVIEEDFWASLSQSLGALTSDNFQTQILSSVDAKYVKEQKVNGVNCYLLELTPDISALQQMMTKQPMVADSGIQLPELKNLVKQISFKVWIAKDTSFLTKVEIELNAEITPQTFGLSTDSSDKLTITLKFTADASDFNQTLAIQLPAEAQNATTGSIDLPFF